jgi:hypothetical protein
MNLTDEEIDIIVSWAEEARYSKEAENLVSKLLKAKEKQTPVAIEGQLTINEALSELG